MQGCTTCFLFSFTLLKTMSRLSITDSLVLGDSENVAGEEVFGREISQDWILDIFTFLGEPLSEALTNFLDGQKKIIDKLNSAFKHSDQFNQQHSIHLQEAEERQNDFLKINIMFWPLVIQPKHGSILSEKFFNQCQ